VVSHLLGAVEGLLHGGPGEERLVERLGEVDARLVGDVLGHRDHVPCRARLGEGFPRRLAVARTDDGDLDPFFLADLAHPQVPPQLVDAQFLRFPVVRLEGDALALVQPVAREVHHRALVDHQLVDVGDGRAHAAKHNVGVPAVGDRAFDGQTFRAAVQDRPGFLEGAVVHDVSHYQRLREDVVEARSVQPDAWLRHLRQASEAVQRCTVNGGCTVDAEAANARPLLPRVFEPVSPPCVSAS